MLGIGRIKTFHAKNGQRETEVVGVKAGNYKSSNFHSAGYLPQMSATMKHGHRTRHGY